MREADDGQMARPLAGWGRTPAGFDRLELADAVGRDADIMAREVHYDYVTQQWERGADHAHYDATRGGRSELKFCGADGVTCREGAGPEELEELTAARIAEDRARRP